MSDYTYRDYRIATEAQQKFMTQLGVSFDPRNTSVSQADLKIKEALAEQATRKQKVETVKIITADKPPVVIQRQNPPAPAVASGGDSNDGSSKPKSRGRGWLTRRRLASKLNVDVTALANYVSSKVASGKLKTPVAGIDYKIEKRRTFDGSSHVDQYCYSPEFADAITSLRAKLKPATQVDTVEPKQPSILEAPFNATTAAKDPYAAVALEAQVKALTKTVEALRKDLKAPTVVNNSITLPPTPKKLSFFGKLLRLLGLS